MAQLWLYISLSLLDRACFCFIFYSFWVHTFFSSLPFRYQYRAIDCLGRFCSEM